MSTPSAPQRRDAPHRASPIETGGGAPPPSPGILAVAEAIGRWLAREDHLAAMDEAKDAG